MKSFIQELYFSFLAFKKRHFHMDALSMTILLGVLVMLVVVIAFVLTVKSGQYDDLDGPAHRILMDDDDPRIPGNRNKNNELK
jgi:cbb3-type cytochrome oxidase maturation protein